MQTTESSSKRPIETFVEIAALTLIWLSPLLIAERFFAAFAPDIFPRFCILYVSSVLPGAGYFIAYWMLYTHISGHRPYWLLYDYITGYRINVHTVYVFLESLAFFIVSIGIFALARPELLLNILFAVCAVIGFVILLNYRLQPARDERAAPQLEAQRAEAERQAAALLTPPPTIASLIRQEYVIIGTAAHSVPIYYREERDNEEQLEHTQIAAMTGYGKTTCEVNVITQHIHYGNGVIVLAAESDLFAKLLRYIPKSRMDDLIYFEPEDLTSPVIGFNPFTLGAGENLNQKIGETRTILKRAMGSDLGKTIEPMIDNVVSALVRRPHATFDDLVGLLNPADKTMRNPLKTDLTLNQKERDFWKEYDDTTYYRNANSYGAVYNRFSRFAESPIDTVLTTSSFSFKDVLNSGRYIIFLDLSRLRDTALVTMGQMLLASIEQSMLFRDNNIDKDDRIPYYLLIDEFQKYAEDSEDTLKALYNGARKYKLAVTVAYQSTGNIPQKLMDTISDNVGTTIALRLAAKSSPHFAKQLQLERPTMLQNLNKGQAYVQTPTHKIGIPVTIPIEPVVPLPRPVSDLKARSKQNFGTEPPTEPVLRDQPDQPDPPKPPAPQKKRSFGLTFE